MSAKIIPIGLALALVSSLAYVAMTYDDGGDDTLCYGTVKVTDSSLSFEIAGRVLSVYVNEGQRAAKGTALALLDTEALKHQRSIETGRCNALHQSYLFLKNGNSKEDIDKALFNLRALENELSLSNRTLVRYKSLLDKKAISKQEYEDILYHSKVLSDKVNLARADLTLMQKGPRQELVLEKKAAYDSCLASLDYLDYKIDTQSIIKAPFDGIVIAQYSHVGDMAGPSVTSFDFGDDIKKEISVYLSSRFLDENAIKAGDEAYVFLNDDGSSYLTGHVSFISQNAMFTPKNVATVELRPDLVYECTIELDDKDRKLRFGSDVTVSFKRP